MTLESLLGLYRDFSIRIIVNDRVGNPMGDMAAERRHRNLVASEIVAMGGPVPENIEPTEAEFDYLNDVFASLVVADGKAVEALRQSGNHGGE